jgi:uncharacterized protein YbcI
MAKLHVSRLAERYPGAMEGGNYRDLMTEIIANNHENIQRAVARVKRDEMGKAAARIKRSTTKQIAVPDLADVLPKRSVYIRKGAEQGQILSDTLRDRLTKDLRSTVADYLGEKMQYKKGEARGQIKPELVEKMRARLTETFAGYRKAGPEGVPPNIQAIAETETRSAIDDIKHTWATRLEESNPGRVRTWKIWRHHPGLSKEPRGNHAIIDGQRRPIGVPFLVPTAKRGRGGWAWGAPTVMQHPHDPSAPIDQVISCHCECDYVTEIL